MSLTAADFEALGLYDPGAAAGVAAEPLPPRRLKGFDDDVELCRLRPGGDG